MLRHTIPTPGAPRHLPLHKAPKPGKCETCGAAILINNGNRRYCHACGRQRAGGRNRIYSDELDQYTPLEIAQRPGFCSRCRIIRLSRADVGGMCAECVRDKVKRR